MELDFVFITGSYQTYTDSSSAPLVLPFNEGDVSYSVLHDCFLSYILNFKRSLGKSDKTSSYRTRFLISKYKLLKI